MGVGHPFMGVLAQYKEDTLLSNFADISSFIQIIGNVY